MFKKKFKLSIMVICVMLMFLFSAMIFNGSFGNKLAEIDGHPMLTAKNIFFFYLK